MDWVHKQAGQNMTCVKVFNSHVWVAAPLLDTAGLERRQVKGQNPEKRPRTCGGFTRNMKNSSILQKT